MYWRIKVAIGILLVIISSYYYGNWIERQRAAIEAAQNDGKAIQNRSKSDEEVLRDGPSGWCIELGGLHPDCSR